MEWLIEGARYGAIGAMALVSGLIVFGLASPVIVAVYSIVTVFTRRKEVENDGFDYEDPEA